MKILENKKESGSFATASGSSQRVRILTDRGYRKWRWSLSEVL
ncbi:hypothetical protein [Lacrimispora sp.]|nr:hypothetical protein [Lacrimispora sp.]